MVWFKVDDKLHSHPKTANVSLAAVGLWAVAGSWCGDHTTDGRVPAAMIESLSRGAPGLAEELVSAGLWVRVRDGFRFHQWLADGDGTKRNPSKKEVEEARAKKAEAGRKGGLASGKARSKPEARAKAGASRLVEPPTRPSPSPKGEGSSGSAPASRGGSRPPNPEPPPAPPPLPSNGQILDRDTAKALARQVATPKRRTSLLDPFLPAEGPDKAQTALDKLDQAIAHEPPPAEAT